MKTEGLSINLATVRHQYDLKTGVEALVKHGIRGVSPWREHVQALGEKEAARIIKSNGMTVTGYCRGGLFGGADPAGQQALIDDNKRMIDEGAAIGAECLVMIGGQESARSLLHLAELFRLADKARVLHDPELAASRMAKLLAVHGLA